MQRADSEGHFEPVVFLSELEDEGEEDNLDEEEENKKTKNNFGNFGSSSAINGIAPSPSVDTLLLADETEPELQFPPSEVFFKVLFYNIIFLLMYY